MLAEMKLQSKKVGQESSIQWSSRLAETPAIDREQVKSGGVISGAAYSQVLRCQLSQGTPFLLSLAAHLG